jgi:sporulation protein YlmC with PRC-barrel domain
MKKIIPLALTLITGLSASHIAWAQVAGSTTLGVSVTEVQQLAFGWSVKKAILGKGVYNDAGDQIGVVDDLIIAPDKRVSYLIIGVGGFVGIGQHKVAVPVTQISEQGERFVMPGATKAVVGAMPRFDYADDAARRTQFLANADKDLAQAREQIAALQKKSAAATSEAKVVIDKQIANLQQDLKAAEAELTQAKHAAASKWQQFADEVSTATARLRRDLESMGK